MTFTKTYVDSTENLPTWGRSWIFKFSSVIFGVNLGAFLGGDEPKQVEAAEDVMRRMDANTS